MMPDANDLTRRQIKISENESISLERPEDVANFTTQLEELNALRPTFDLSNLSSKNSKHLIDDRLLHALCSALVNHTQKPLAEAKEAFKRAVGHEFTTDGGTLYVVKDEEEWHRLRKIFEHRLLVAPTSRIARTIQSLDEANPLSGLYARLLWLDIPGIPLRQTSNDADLPSGLTILNSAAVTAAFEVELARNGLSNFHGWADYMFEIRQQIQEGEARLKVTGNEVDNLVEALRSKVKTDAAVQYWIDKSTSHSSELRNLRWWFVAWGAVSVLLSGAIVWVLARSDVALLQAPLWAVVLVATVGLSSVWFGRVLVRMLFAELMLRQDADARATITKTFVAMVAEGAARDEQADIVLRALCYPAPLGQATQDVSPALPSETIIKMASDRLVKNG